MSLRLQLGLGAVGAALAAAYLLLGLTPAVAVLGITWALVFLVGFPQTTLTLLLLTLSCDQILDLHLGGGGANLRLAQLCTLALLLRMGLGRLRAGEGWGFPLRAFQPLWIYLALACAGAFASENLPKTVGYLAWATVDIFGLFAVILALARTERGFERVRRAWVAGAFIAAGFGMLQLALGFAHLPVPLAAQKLGSFPRINGFNYEPAYYALYLESVAAVYLGRFVAGGPGSGRAGGMGAALLVPAALSMSRSGWLGMGLLGAYVLFRGIRRARRRALLLAVAAAGAVVAGGLAVLPARFLAQGPRMAAAALNPHEASSSAPRLEMLAQAVKIFRRHPVLGVGLGGYGGFVTRHPELTVFHMTAKDAFDTVTTNLWLEQASEQGLVSVAVLLWFLGSLLLSLWRARSLAALPERGWVEGLGLSVALVFAVLFQFNQTLWRLDVWVLLGLAWATVARVQAGRARAAESAA